MEWLTKEDFKWAIKNKCNLYALEWYQDLDPISKQHLDNIFDSLEDYIDKQTDEVLEFREKAGYERGLEEGYEIGYDKGLWDCECEDDD